MVLDFLVLIVYNMKLFWEIIHSCRGSLIRVDSFICGSALKDSFPMSLWVPLHRMPRQQKIGCVTLSIPMTGKQRSSTGGHSLSCVVVYTEVHPGNMAMEKVPLHLVAP